MTRLPRLKGKEIIRLLERIGFRAVRTRGSHVFLKHADGRVTTIPVHAGEVIGPGLLRSILRDVELPVEDLLRLMRQ
ncbi:MAG: type II toxin-antitoxin system HicA family toxin [Terriglobales bacterium]